MTSTEIPADLPASIPEALAARAARPDDDFVIGPDFRITFGEADQRSLDLAQHLLAAGIGKGTRLGMLHPTSAEWVVTWLAAARIGALTVPLSTFAPARELVRTMRVTDVHALLVAGALDGADLGARLEEGLPGLDASGSALALADLPYLRWVHMDGDAPHWSRPLDASLPVELVVAAQSEVTPADALALITTSGTTAAPKAVLHTHGSLVRHAAVLAERRGYSPLDRIYSPMPFFWVGGLTMVLLAGLTSGAGVVVQPRFDAGEALELAERERVTQISCWPNAARALAEHPTFSTRDLRSVRGGTLIEALPPEQRPASPDLAPNLLGMSETGGPHTSADDPYAPLPEHLRGTFGRPLPGMEHRIVDPATGVPLAPGVEGELQVRGDFLMDGLHKRERRDTFTPDGWYSTGDLGWFDDHGHLHFTGRRTGTIKTGGSNVAPAEVEAALVELDGVRSAFVFGVPAGDRGEDVAAVVVVENGVDLVEVEVIDALRERLSSYKVPRRYCLLSADAVPMLPTGKVDAIRLRDLV
jgi:acyl-CoA synthetase (AMP-forming)/AMP-acid ligase II